jgi:hypothetical protein
MLVVLGEKKKPNKAGIGPDTSDPCCTQIGLFLDLKYMN